MHASWKLLILVFAFAVGACASSRPAKRANFKSALNPSRDYGMDATTGQRSRSFESVAEVVPPAVQEGSGAMAGQDKAAEGLDGEFMRRQPSEPPADAPQPGAAYAPPPAPPPAPEGGQPPVRQPIVADVSPGQMLVYTANLTMAVYQVDQGLAAVERVARELDGYLAMRADLAITIRVPRAKFEAALKAIEGSGDVVHRDIKAEDVTDEFFDTEVRARNARAMRDRLAKLLQQAAVKEALEIEKELARVTQEIELLEGKLKLLRHRIAYSTINVTFRPRETAIASRPTRLPFPWLEQLGLRNLLRLEEGE